MKRHLVLALSLGTGLLSLVTATALLHARPAPWLAALEPEAPLSAQIASEPLQPAPASPPADPRKVALGKRLFHDKRLSHDDTIACASCHDLGKGGTDNLPHSLGINQAVGGINAPTVYNSGLNFKQFWNGRAGSLEEQVNGPTHHPKEMGSNWKEILGKLRQDADYRHDFDALYADGIQEQNVRDSIATFERSLNTPDAPLDRFLKGDTSALSEDAQAGYHWFKSYGCASCHQGRNIGGNMYQHMGVMKDYFGGRGNLTDADLGRYTVTHREEDRYLFRVPSLRNIAKTAPYFHDGSAPTLADAVQVMAAYQLGRPIPTKKGKQIVAFLESLTGEYAGAKL